LIVGQDPLAEAMKPPYADGSPIHLTERERNYGVYVLGKTGSGKTVDISQMTIHIMDYH